MIKVGMISLGCTKNQIDGEHMLGMLGNSAEFELCTDPARCDAVIINTCGFIEDAKKESIENILEMCELKKESDLKAVVVTGCLAERYREELAAEIPEVDVVLGIGSNGEIGRAIKQAIAGQRTLCFGEKQSLELEGDRVLTNAPYFAYIKVAEGCDNRCTYCAIPSIRGSFRSRPIEKILEEAEKLALGGAKEINLVAQDTTRYGEDLYGKLMLPELIRRVCAIDSVRWVRILYCYPERVTDELLDTMASEPKVVKYMDMPIQHAAGSVLARMNRRGNFDSLLALTRRMREKMPDIILRTTLIVGFPGESEEEFTELCELVKLVKFERLGCFKYSREEDTPAERMENQIDEDLKDRRADAIMALQADISAEFTDSRAGGILEVLTEGFDPESGLYYGRSYMDAPDIDTKVFFESSLPVAVGEFANVLVTESLSAYDLIGKAIFKDEKGGNKN